MSRVAILLIAIIGSTGVMAGPEDAYNKTTDAKKIGWMDRGKKAVKSTLKDPASAQFRNVYFHKGADGIPVTCGEVNSKNSFGGYGGFQKFLSAGKPDTTYLENKVSGFDGVWEQFCM